MKDDKLELWLISNKVWHHFIEKIDTIHTADASSVTGIELHRITKNLVATTEKGEHVILIIPGDMKVDLKEAARVLRVKNVRLMSFDQSEAISGFPPGGTPSLGFKTSMRVIVDIELQKFTTFYCGGGVRNRLLEVRFEDVMKFNRALLVKISI